MWKWVKRVMVVGMLLASSAIVVLWVRSYYATDGFQCGGRGEGDQVFWVISVDSRRGGAEIGYHRWTYGLPTDHFHPVAWIDDGMHWKGAGFEWDCWYSSRSIWANIALTVPCWFLLLLTGLFPAIVGFRYVRRRRREGRRGFAVEVKGISTGGGEGPQKSR